MNNFIKAYWLCLMPIIIIVFGGSCLLFSVQATNVSEHLISSLLFICLLQIALFAVNAVILVLIFVPLYWMITKFFDFDLFCCLATGVVVVLLNIAVICAVIDYSYWYELFWQALSWSIGFGLIYGALFAFIYKKFNNGYKNQSYDGV